jgi:peptide/nickel transport system substrate-binding protein
VLRQLYYSPFGTTGFAYAHYDNPEVDKLVDEGMRELDPAKRAEIYRKVQKIVINDAVSVPVRRMRAVYAISARVKDLGFTAVGFPLFYDASLAK